MIEHVLVSYNLGLYPATFVRLFFYYYFFNFLPVLTVQLVSCAV